MAEREFENQEVSTLKVFLAFLNCQKKTGGGTESEISETKTLRKTKTL